MPLISRFLSQFGCFRAPKPKEEVVRADSGFSLSRISIGKPIESLPDEVAVYDGEISPLTDDSNQNRQDCFVVIDYPMEHSDLEKPVIEIDYAALKHLKPGKTIPESPYEVSKMVDNLSREVGTSLGTLEPRLDDASSYEDVQSRDSLSTIFITSEEQYIECENNGLVI